MLEIIKKYIVDENNNRLAVEIDIDTFNRMEEIMEEIREKADCMSREYGIGQFSSETA